MSVRDPFACSVDVAERIRDVKHFDATQCRAALKVPYLQATVRQAIERRLRSLSKRGPAA